MNAITALNQNQCSFHHILQRYEPEFELTWCTMRQAGRPCFTKSLLEELAVFQRTLQINANPDSAERTEPTRYMVFNSAADKTYSLGGDLELFARLIRARKVEALRDYAMLSIQVLYQNAIAYNLPLTTIALIEGDAIGAGLEAALSCDIVIAERNTKMGFPEALFGLFPGMGAHSFISRKVDIAKLESMILSGRLYSAEEMYEMGLVDHLVEAGEGQAAVRDFISKKQRKLRLLKSLRSARMRLNPITLDELQDIANIWVESAMQLGERELKIMDRLVRAQEKKFSSSD